MAAAQRASAVWVACAVLTWCQRCHRHSAPGELGVGGCVEAWGAGSSCNPSARLRCHLRRRCRVAVPALPGAERAQLGRTGKRGAAAWGRGGTGCGGLRVHLDPSHGPRHPAGDSLVHGHGCWHGHAPAEPSAVGVRGTRDGVSAEQRVPGLCWAWAPRCWLAHVGLTSSPALGCPRLAWVRVSSSTIGAKLCGHLVP